MMATLRLVLKAGGMLRARWRAHVVALVLVCLPHAAIATDIQMTAGDCSVINYGNNNQINNSCTRIYATYALGSTRKLRQRDDELERKIKALDESRSHGDGRVAELEAELRAMTKERLASNDKLRDLTEKSLEIGAKLEGVAQMIQDPALRAQARAALLDGDLDAARDAIYKSEGSEGDGRLGAMFALVSDQLVGHNGYCGGLFLSANAFSMVRSRMASLTMGSSLDLLFGAASLPQDSQFFMSLAVRAGPRLRLGNPLAFTIGVYYDFPMVMYSQGGAYAPLIGVAGDIGIQYKLVKVTVLYRYDFNHVRYSERPDLSLFGIGLTFLGRSRHGTGYRWAFGD